MRAWHQSTRQIYGREFVQGRYHVAFSTKRGQSVPEQKEANETVSTFDKYSLNAMAESLLKRLTNLVNNDGR